MVDKKFGQKRVCPHCEKKFYDLNKKSPLTCPCGEKEIVIDDELLYGQSPQFNQQQNKSNVKDEFADIENTDSSSEDSDDDMMSLDDPAMENTAETN